MPMRTPARTPADSTPMIASAAMTKSKRETRYRRRSSGTSIIPITTASMMSAASTALGRSENSGAKTSSVSTTSAPVMSDASWVRAPADSLRELAERLVETGMPWKKPAPTLATPCATVSWLTSTR